MRLDAFYKAVTDERKDSFTAHEKNFVNSSSQYACMPTDQGSCALIAGTDRQTDGRIAVSVNAPYGEGITIRVMVKGTPSGTFPPIEPEFATNCGSVQFMCCEQGLRTEHYSTERQSIGNESVPKIMINNTISLFLELQSAFW